MPYPNGDEPCGHRSFVTEAESHYSLSLLVCTLMCVYVCFEAVRDISLAVTGNDLISPLVTGGTQGELYTHTHTVKGKDVEKRLVL